MQVSTDELKKALGPRADKMSEQELERLNTLFEKLSGALFDTWNKQLKRNLGLTVAEKRVKIEI